MVLIDKPGCFYYFGIFFVLIGLLAALTAFFMPSPETEVPTLDRVITVVVGILAAAGGAYFVFNTPRSKVIVENEGRILSVSQTGFQLRVHENYKSTDIEDIYVVESDEPEHAREYSLRMRHVNGEDIPLSINWFKDRSLLEENAALLKKNLSR